MSADTTPVLLGSKKVGYVMEKDGKPSILFNDPDTASTVRALFDMEAVARRAQMLINHPVRGASISLDSYTRIDVLSNFETKVLENTTKVAKEGTDILHENEMNDPVNHPKHYTSHPSGVECIEITRHMGFNLGNVVKYVWRDGLKDTEAPLQDLKKALWYLQDEIKMREGTE